MQPAEHCVTTSSNPAKRPWVSPRVEVLSVTRITRNTPDCGTVDTPCTKQSSFGPEDCGTC